MKHGYSLTLAFAGITTALVFLAGAAALIYGGAQLIVAGGFWVCLAGVLCGIPAAWCLFLAGGVTARAVVNQR